MDTFYGNSARITSRPIAVYCFSTLEPSVSRNTDLINFMWFYTTVLHILININLSLCTPWRYVVGKTYSSTYT